MKEIKLISLELNNFKCHSHLKIDFNGRNVSLLGDNATGKTSVYDSLTWLLFSKDSKGNGEKNIEIKPLGEGGKVKDHDALTEVEAVLSVDGEEISFKRTYQEVWTTKRGSSEATYDGNTSEYYVDGVPCKKFVFSEKVTDLVDEETFRLLTNVSHFADGITWQERRAVLFKVAGVLEDEEIMTTDERFISLIESKGKLSIDDYKKKLLADKRGFVGAKTEIPARINECQKTIDDVEEIDFDKARAELEGLDVKRSALEAQVIAIEHDVASDNKRVEIREARLELDKLVAENEAYRASQMTNVPDITSMRSNFNRLQMQLNAKKNSLSSTERLIRGYDAEIAASRERWITVNSEAFAGGNCPTCGQGLPTQQLKTATDRFEAQKSARLREIEQTANAKKEAKAQQETRLDELNAEIKTLKEEMTAAEARIKVAENYIVTPVNMQGFEEKKKTAEDKIHSLNTELADMSANTSAVRESLRNQINEIAVECKKQRELISRESLLAYSRKRIEELQEDARNAAACLEAIEGMLYLIEEYSRYKTQFVEESINSLFSLARFRLFREQANGGIEDRCDVVYNEIPYINVNNGAKINVGIDIINTLSRAYGVTVPLFIDNAESVTKLEKYEGQVIRLAVSENDKILRCEYEN